MYVFVQKFSSSNCPTKRHQERAVSSTQSIYSKSTSWKLFLKSVDWDFSIKCLTFTLTVSLAQIGKTTGRVFYDNNVAACAAFRSK